MTKLIEDLELLKIDRVRKGSNPGSRIVLMKGFVEKTTLEDVHNLAAKAVGEAGVQMSYFETLDVDNTVAIFRDYEGTRWGLQLEQNGDGFVASGDPFAVVAEFRPVTKSDAPASGEGEATVPTKREDLDEAALALLVEVEKERDEAVAKAEAAAAEILVLTAAAAEAADETEDVLKGLSEDARSLIEKAQSESAAAMAKVEKMELERETDRFVSIAKSDFGKSGEDAIETASALQAVASTHGEDSAVYKTVYKTIKGASALVDAAMGSLGHPVGSSRNLGGAGEDAGSQMRTLVKEYIAEHKVGFTAAWSAVQKAHPELTKANDDARAVRATTRKA